jgi:anthranilate phosphoribosyltransferase
MIEKYLDQLSAGRSLSLDQAREVFDTVMQGSCSEEQIERLLLSLREKGESVDEVAGAALSLRKHMTKIRSKRAGVVDTCGTGGDGSGTFNISTAAAIVTAAAGVPVAKHGNRSITSRSGSADVLAALGVNIEASVDCVACCLDQLGICFCFAPQLHPAMKHVAAVRRKLAVPTIFNLLGPLCNPAEAPFQLLGVGKPHLHELLAAALARIGIEHAVVVCGEDSLDEVTLSGATRVIEIQGEGLRKLTWTPDDFGLQPAGKEAMLVDGPEESAKVIERVFAGEVGPPRDIVLLNSAAAIWTAGAEMTLKSAAARAAAAIDSGEARALVQRLAEMSHA